MAIAALCALAATARSQPMARTKVLTIPVETKAQTPAAAQTKPIPATLPEAATSVNEWAKEPERPEKDEVLVTTSKGHPEVALTVARDLIDNHGAEKPAETYRAVSKLLDQQPAGSDPRAAEVYLSLGLYQIRAGRNEEAAQALTKVIALGEKSGVDRNTINIARYEAAGLAQKAGRYDEAFTSLKAVIESDPLAVSSVRGAVEALQGANKRSAVTDLCEDLLHTHRYTQALQCVRSAANEVPKIDEVRLETYAKVPFLTGSQLREIVREQPAVARSLPGIDNCVRGETPRVDWHSFQFGPPEDPAWRQIGDNTAGVYLNAGQSESSLPSKRCFLTYSALSCFFQIDRKKTCPSVQSLASYAEFLSKGEDKSTLRSFVDAMLFEKGRLYAALANHSVDAGRALFHLHLALAYVFKRIGDGNNLLEHSAYHVDRAKFFWKELTHTPMPVDLLP